jgi:hypothetical protein
MSKVHAKDTYVSLNGVNLSLSTNASELTSEADSHDVTCYGADGHDFEGGLLTGTASMSGIYDNDTAPSSAAGPRAVIMPLVGTRVTYVRRPEGTGSGKPQDSATVLVQKYNESNPVADMIKWSVDLQVCGVITPTTQ